MLCLVFSLTPGFSGVFEVPACLQTVSTVYCGVRGIDDQTGQIDGAAASPSLHDEGVGRGPGRGETLENIDPKPTPLFQSTPLPGSSLALSPLRRERELALQCRPSCGLLGNSAENR